MAKSIRTVFASFAFLTMTSTLSEASENGVTQFDPEYSRLAPSFVVPASDLRYSTAMESFLAQFASEFEARFSASDAEKIATHRDGWFESLRLIINLSNAYNYLELSKFDALEAEEFDRSTLIDYAETLERLEDEHERRIVEHHRSLLARLSSDGEARLTGIVDGKLRAEFALDLASGAARSTRLDMRAFIDSYPSVVARQLHLESQQRKSQGAPRELVYVTKTVASPAPGVELRALALVPKEASN